MYPQEALMRGICGRVIVQFTVSKNGSTKNIKVLESTNEIFEVSAKNSVMKYKYEPRIIQGQAIDVDDVETAVTFKIDSEGDEEYELLCEAGLQGRTVEDLKKERYAAIKEAEEKQRLLKKELEKETYQRELQARRDEFIEKKENLYSDYEYGTKTKPIVKDLELANFGFGIYVSLDFGKGVKIRAVRGKLTCIDVFDEFVINNQVEDKTISILSNEVKLPGSRYMDELITSKTANIDFSNAKFNFSYEYERPLDSIHNIASFDIIDRGALEYGDIEGGCTFIPTKTVFE